jgi:hypothetical protein
MKLQWMDEGKTKVLVELQDREVFGDYTGPGSFQIVANPNHADFARIKDMDPAPEIAEVPHAAAPAAAKAAAPAAEAPPAAAAPAKKP